MSERHSTYESTSLPVPNRDAVPERWLGDVWDLFDTWHAVRARNDELSSYYDMKNALRDLGISIPPQLVGLNCVVGWARKAVSVMEVRSKFDGYSFEGRRDAWLDAMVRDCRLRAKYAHACRGSLVHGVAHLSVMAGGPGRPPVVVRALSANQSCSVWDKDAERIGAGVMLCGTDGDGNATRYVVHLPDAVLDLTRVSEGRWECDTVPNPMGRPMMEPVCHDADSDHPLGRSRITREVRGIIDKAMRDVMRMEVGAEFFTAPQRYVLGADEGLFDPAPDEDGPDEGPVVLGADGLPLSELPRRTRPPASQAERMRVYMGAILAITRDQNGDIPTVGQFPAADAANFVATFENDAQRFSGATNVPLGQLGVLSNTYTSSDALGAANDPLILEVEAMNARNKESMEEVARMALAIREGCAPDELPDDLAGVQASFPDPSLPTLAATVDAWTKLASQDEGIVGTDVYYEHMRLSREEIDRLRAQRSQAGAIGMLGEIAASLAAADGDGADG